MGGVSGRVRGSRSDIRAVPRSPVERRLGICRTSIFPTSTPGSEAKGSLERSYIEEADDAYGRVSGARARRSS